MARPRSHCYEYPRPAVSVDLVVFAWSDAALEVLLIRRRRDPHAGAWALPGGFLDPGEEPEAAARRELREETGLEAVPIVEPLGFFGAVDRDPRERVISLAHVGVVGSPRPSVAGGDDAAEAAWVPLDRIDRLAFDHDQILARARRWLAAAVAEGPAGRALLPRDATGEVAGALLRAVGVATPAADWMAASRPAR